MSGQQKGVYGSNLGRENASDSQLEYHNYAMGTVPEPVTPPASGHSSVLYSNPYYLSHTQPLSSKPQYSPNLSIREQVAPQYGYGSMGSSSLASPVDTPLYNSYNSQQTYLGTPHTPMSSTATDGSSIPSTPNTSRPLGMSVGRTNGGNNGNGSFPGITPLGHARSYSYNIRDTQQSLGRLSLSGNTNTGGSNMHERELRPRAYSSGIAGAPVPLAGSLNHSAIGQQQAMDLSSSHHPFPPPLSSPIRPENLTAMSSRQGHRSQYSHPFASSSDEQQLAGGTAGVNIPGAGNGNGATGGGRSGLHRSLSAMSSLASSGFPGGMMGHMAHNAQNDDLVDPHSFSSTGASPGIPTGRRPSPPMCRTQQRQRRSSSGASSSSILDVTIAPSGNAGVAAGGTSASKGPATTVSIDIANADNEQIYSLCKDQRGCRYLQRKLSEGDTVIIRSVFSATHKHIVTLMMDPFGNYLCQKLFEYCSPEEITQLLLVAAPSLPTVAINQHGTRALQKLIDAVTTSDQVEILIKAMDGHVVRLIRDLNGNHVIQKLLLDLDSRGSQFIYDAVCKSVVEIGSHRHGCCVLQRCLDYAQDYNRNNLVAHIVAKALVLVCDPFGNYVCQYVIDLGVQDYTDSLVRQLLGKLSGLSVQKFSSNVVEKCLRSASPGLQRELVSEIMAPKTLHELLLDNYGNYVIQTALESSSSMDPSTKQELAVSIQSALTTTRSPYGRRVMSKLKSW